MMKTNSLFAVVLLFGLLSTAFTQQASGPSEIANSVVQIVVKFTDEQSQERVQAVGTGFFVTDRIIATAAHIYWQSGQLLVGKRESGVFARKVSSGKGFLVPIGGGRIDNQHDLTTFEFDPAAIKRQWPEFVIKPLTLTKNDAEMGDRIFLIGFFEQDLNPIVSQGIVATSSAPDLYLDLHASPGESGGPVLSVTTGQVIGVQSGIIQTTISGNTQPAGLCKASRIKFLREILPTR
jgi:V8-like Glu-specific endopeptidase